MEDDLTRLPPRDMPAARAEEIRRYAQARLARARALADEAARAPNSGASRKRYGARPTPLRLRLELAAGTAFSIAHVAWALLKVLA
jgi:hypothetical protein